MSEHWISLILCGVLLALYGVAMPIGMRVVIPVQRALERFAAWLGVPLG